MKREFNYLTNARTSHICQRVLEDGRQLAYCGRYDDMIGARLTTEPTKPLCMVCLEVVEILARQAKIAQSGDETDALPLFEQDIDNDWIEQQLEGIEGLE